MHNIYEDLFIEYHFTLLLLLLWKEAPTIELAEDGGWPKSVDKHQKSKQMRKHPKRMRNMAGKKTTMPLALD